MSQSTIDLARPRRIHIIGIGGAGMAAIADVLDEMGHDVRGSDLTGSAAFDRLVAKGLRCSIGHDAANVADAEIIARSTAIPDHNPEVAVVIDRGGVVLRRAELLGAITSTCRTIAVAGTHGKTTTSSMLAVIAREGGLNPSFIIGGDVTQLGTGSAWGSPDWFVVEADESDGSFLELGHTVGLVTNVEPDHLEHYGGEAGLRSAFETFVDEAETSVICLDDDGAAALAGRPGVVTYGLEADADYRMVGLERHGMGSSFGLVANGRELGRLDVPMPGLHNARNAAGAATVALESGVPFDAVREGLAGFGGVARRFDHRGEARDVMFVDDYAHLPTEVRSAIDAAGDIGRARIVTIFQPHRFSRTEALWRDFAGAFDGADLLVVTDIYASGEAARPGVTGQLIVDAVIGQQGHPEVIYLADRDQLAADVSDLLTAGDLCLTLGAGDLVSLADEIQSLFAGVD